MTYKPRLITNLNTTIIKKPRLSYKQKAFIKEAVKTLNPTEAIVRSYDVKNRVVAKSMASENLAKPYLKEALEQAMEEQGITDDLLLKEHKKVIIQSKHLPSKNTAIDMAYKLKGSYAPDKKQVSNLNININDSEQVLKRLRDLKDELKEATGDTPRA